MGIRSYKDYFHGMAVRHKKLRHDPASDAPDGPLGGKRFTVFTQEDVITGLRTEIPESPVLHLHLYDLHGKDNGGGDMQGLLDAGFMITQYAEANDTDGQIEAWATCEEIAEDLLLFITYDEINMNRCLFPLGIIDWNTLDMSFVGPLWNGRFGVFVQVKYQVKRESYPDQARIDAAFNPKQIFESQFEETFE